jgi:hypothetical protein
MKTQTGSFCVGVPCDSSSMPRLASTNLQPEVVQKLRSLQPPVASGNATIFVLDEGCDSAARSDALYAALALCLQLKASLVAM